MLIIYQPTVRRPDSHQCSGCANASSPDEFGTRECRYLDDPANVDEDEAETAALVCTAWAGDDPDECPGWQEPTVAACEQHGTYLVEHGCGPCEAEFYRDYKDEWS